MQSALVIDLGASSLKLLELDETKGRPVIKRFYTAEFPPEIQEKSYPDNEFLTSFLKEALIKSGINTKRVNFILPDYTTDLLLLTMPRQTREELKTSLKWELRDRISFPIEEAVFDYHIVREFEEAGVPKMAILAAVVPQSEIKGYVKLLTDAGLEPFSFSVDFRSLIQIIKQSGLTQGDEEILVLDIGAKTTKLGIFNGDSITLFRRMDIGGRGITLALMNESTDIFKAEDIKRGAGISTLDTEDEAAQRNFGFARPILEDLVSKIGENINFYKESLRGSEIKKLFIFGGGARLKGLKTFLSSTLGIPVFSPDPFAGVDTEGIDKKQLEDQSISLARSWGVFLAGGKGINLLPLEIRFKDKIKRQRMFFEAGAYSIISVLVLMYAFVFFKGVILTKGLSRLEKEYNGMGQAIDRMEGLERDRDLLQKRMDLCIELSGKEPFWEDVLKEIGRIIPDNIILSELRIQKSGQGKEEGLMRMTSKPKEGTILLLEGTVSQGEITMERSLTGFLKLLSESAYFSDTKLNISKENKTENKTVIEFIIQSKVRPLEIETL